MDAVFDLVGSGETRLDAVTPASGLGEDARRSRLVECEQAVCMLHAVQAGAMVQMGARARAAHQAEVALVQANPAPAESGAQLHPMLWGLVGWPTLGDPCVDEPSPLIRL